MTNQPAEFSCVKCGEKFTDLNALKEHASQCLTLPSCCQSSTTSVGGSEVGATKSKIGAWIAAGLAVLFIAFLMQTWQLVVLMKKIDAVAPAAAQNLPSNQQAPLPSSIQNLPNMVGGC